MPMEFQSGTQPGSPIKQLYSIDWAVRFDEFKKFDQSNHSDLNQLLAKIEQTAASEVNANDTDLNDTDVLAGEFSNAQKDSSQWHCLAILINLSFGLRFLKG